MRWFWHTQHIMQLAVPVIKTRAISIVIQMYGSHDGMVLVCNQTLGVTEKHHEIHWNPFWEAKNWGTGTVPHKRGIPTFQGHTIFLTHENMAPNLFSSLHLGVFSKGGPEPDISSKPL